MKKSILLLIPSCVLMMTSCKKEDKSTGGTTNNTPQTASEKLMSGSWIEVDAKMSGTSFWKDVPSCIKDDVVTFKANGVLETDNGAEKCKPGDPQVKTATWELKQNDIYLNMGASGVDYLLVELTDQKFVGLYSYSGGSLEVTYQKR